VNNEIQAFLRAHEEEARAEPLDETAPWYVRVSTLHAERISLAGPARRIMIKREVDDLMKAYEDGIIDEEEGREKFNAIMEKKDQTEIEIQSQYKRTVSTLSMIKDFFGEEYCPGE